VKVGVLVLAALAVAGCGGQSAPGGRTSGAASLDISISLGGKDTPTKVWTLRCPTGGTLPDAERVCLNLDRLDDPFGPVPKSVACTQVYGGPQVADVQGTFRGKPVNTRFRRTDGCEIARWNRVRFLFPDT
jgi:subtilisin inhibitor-like